MKQHRKLFFIVVNSIYDYMPHRFREEVKRGNFYRYIQDERVKVGEKHTSIKSINLPNEEFVNFVKEFMQFTYVNVVGYYYDIENIEIISRNLEKKIKKLTENE